VIDIAFIVTLALHLFCCPNCYKIITLWCCI